MTAVFFGEGATEEGVFFEALNFAALKQLPVVFICENNLYSVYSPMAVRQPPARDRVMLAKAHGMEGVRGDGNDVEAVFRLAGEADETYGVRIVVDGQDWGADDAEQTANVQAVISAITGDERQR